MNIDNYQQSIIMDRINWQGESRTSYKGILAQQNPNTFNEFEKFFNNETFDYVIEIGTSYGGLALFLHDQSLKHKFKFITYDWSGFKDGAWSNRIYQLKSTMPSGNLSFDYRDKNIFENTDEIINILKNNKCLLLCDGGDKPKEFNIFGKHLTSGSYIMAHDYASDETDFETNVRNKIWNWFEIQDSDIQETMNENNIVKSNYFDDFVLVAWIHCEKRDNE